MQQWRMIHETWDMQKWRMIHGIWDMQKWRMIHGTWDMQKWRMIHETWDMQKWTMIHETWKTWNMKNDSTTRRSLAQAVAAVLESAINYPMILAMAFIIFMNHPIMMSESSAPDPVLKPEACSLKPDRSSFLTCEACGQEMWRSQDQTLYKKVPQQKFAHRYVLHCLSYWFRF